VHGLKIRSRLRVKYSICTNTLDVVVYNILRPEPCSPEVENVSAAFEIKYKAFAFDNVLSVWHVASANHGLVCS